jgi:hypothetical protein
MNFSLHKYINMIGGLAFARKSLDAMELRHLRWGTVIVILLYQRLGLSF